MISPSSPMLLSTAWWAMGTHGHVCGMSWFSCEEPLCKDQLPVWHLSLSIWEIIKTPLRVPMSSTLVTKRKKNPLVSHVSVSTYHPTGSQKSSVHWDENTVRKGCRQPVRDHKNITLFNCPCSCSMQALLKPSSQIWELLKYCIYFKGWLPRKLALQMSLLSAAAKAYPVL